MDHQKCRLCGDRHPLGPCPSLANKSKAEKISELKDHFNIVPPLPPREERFGIDNRTVEERSSSLEDRCRRNGLTIEVAAEKYLDGLEKTRLRLAKHRSKS